jgi:phosphotransferase system enzyme I (PtsI)
MEAVRKDLLTRSRQAGKSGDAGLAQAAPILESLSQMASDPTLRKLIEERIDAGSTAPRAVYDGFAQFETKLTDLGGYMAERAGDLHDVGQRVIARITGAKDPGLPHSDHPYVLVAPDLSPADTAALDLSKVQAIVTSEGGPTSHTAILARSRGIVAVVAAQGADDIADDAPTLVDAAAGKVIVNPDKDQIQHMEDQRRKAAQAAELRGTPGATKDGFALPLLANVGKPEDGASALNYGAEGVGLFRTEFLFLSQQTAPSMEQQAQAYEQLLEQFPGKKVVIRLLDAGADKPLPFLSSADEPNPALGVRGLRALREHKSVLEDQLKALAQADSHTHADLWVMAPMVADASEAKYFTDLGHSYGLKRVGVMAEIPAVALVADQVGEVTDFVSIVTNDLTQYIMAADRTLGAVSSYQSAWHPAVLRAIKLIADAGAENNMPVGVCGEAAADPDMAVVLAGLGVTSLSMSPASLDAVRYELSQHSLAEAKVLAEDALNGLADRT